MQHTLQKLHLKGYEFDLQNHVNQHSSLRINLKNELDPIEIVEFRAHQSRLF